MQNIKLHIKGSFPKEPFSFYLSRAASSCNINGYVEAQKDDSLFIEAEGYENNIQEFINWCKEGPFAKKVSRFDQKTGEIRNFRNFTTKNETSSKTSKKLKQFLKKVAKRTLFQGKYF